MGLLVISDASPIRALHHLGLLWLCERLYGRVIVPGAVCTELLQPTRTCVAIDIKKHTGFEIRSAQHAPRELGVPIDLDPGETEAIVLALELHAGLVLIDERKGTAVARDLGLSTIGVFGILLEAKRRALIPHVLPCVDRLSKELGFFTSPALRRRLADLSEE